MKIQSNPALTDLRGPEKTCYRWIYVIANIRNKRKLTGETKNSYTGRFQLGVGLLERGSTVFSFKRCCIYSRDLEYVEYSVNLLFPMLLLFL